MADEPESQSTNTLDFERASFEGDANHELRCQSCERAIHDHYYTAGQAIVCEACRHQIEAELANPQGGSAFLRAGVFGLGAAAVGAALWGVIVKVTGYEIGLIAIAVGWVVGAAVRAGTRHRGGRLYQLMAVALTYLAIVSTYVPYIVAEFRDAEAVAVEEPEASAAAGELQPAGEPEPAIEGRAEGEAVEVPPTVGDMALAAAAILAIAMAAPFLAGFENIIGLLIIGFALWQAWSMNRRIEVTISGPFQADSADRAAGS